MSTCCAVSDGLTLQVVTITSALALGGKSAVSPYLCGRVQLLPVVGMARGTPVLATASAGCYTARVMKSSYNCAVFADTEEPIARTREAGLDRAWAVRVSHHPSSMLLIRPSATASISVTGTRCALNCAHCGGRYLQHMQSIQSVDLRSAKSCLISGGCDARGVVPIGVHAQSITLLGRDHRLNLHLGLMDASDLLRLRIPVDVISMDVVGDRQTALEVYGLDVTLDRYMAQLDALREIGPVVPHITIGLHAGQIRGEYAAIDALRERPTDRLVFIVLIPTAGTRYADCDPPPLEEVADVLSYARCALPECRIYLGCMRPHGRYRQQLDVLAVRAGVNAIVNPTRAGEQAVQAAGLSVIWGDECCALY